jgi:hypothetical protein
MRIVGLALALFASAAACSELLDTDSLQSKSGTTGAGGTGGQSGANDAMTDAPAKTCTGDADCLPGVEIDGCTVYACGPAEDRTCRPPHPNSGALGIVSAGSVETVMTADDIGYPSLLVDGGDIIMGVWHRTGSTSDVLLRKYPAYPQTGAGLELSEITNGMFKSYASSPGMIVKQAVPRRVRLLVAAERTGDAGAGTGMRLVDIDVPAIGNNLKFSIVQPPLADVGVTGYDTRPRLFAPRLLANGTAEPTGMWIQQGKFFYFDGAAAREAYSAKKVLGYSPLSGATGVHAALETTVTDADGGNTGPSRTELWSDGSAALASLDGDQPGARHGVTSTYANESGSSINLVAWSFEPKVGVPALNYRVALCAAMSCTSLALTGQSDAIPAMFPEMTSVPVSATDRDVLQSFEIIFADTTQPTLADSALFASVSRFNIPSPDLTKGSSTPINPPVFIVDLAQGPLGAAAGDVLGPSSVAITRDGQLMVAWVVHPTPSTSVLRARRYLVKTCP